MTHSSPAQICSTATIDVISTAMLVITFAFFSLSDFDGFKTET
jgi:hypothetical protein